MDKILNKYLIVVPKNYEHNNDVRNYKKEHIFNFNDLFFRYITKTEPSNLIENIITMDSLLEYGIKVNENLCLKVLTKKDSIYTSFHPYSMRQANFLYKEMVPIEYLLKLYQFNENEIMQGYAVREGLKTDFYPNSMESNTKGYYYFHQELLEKPEFISKEGLLNLLP